MSFTTTYKGKDDQNGWLVLDLAGADTDGVSKIYIPYMELDQLRKKGDTTASRLLAARALLGGDEETLADDSLTDDSLED